MRNCFLIGCSIAMSICLLVTSGCGTPSGENIYDADGNMIKREYTIQDCQIPNFEVYSKVYYIGKVYVNKHYYLILKGVGTGSFVHDPDCSCYKHSVMKEK